MDLGLIQNLEFEPPEFPRLRICICVTFQKWPQFPLYAKIRRRNNALFGHSLIADFSPNSVSEDHPRSKGFEQFTSKYEQENISPTLFHLSSPVILFISSTRLF